MIDTVKGFGIVNKAEIDVFLELSCLFDDPVDVGNLISVSSAFSKFNLNIWKFKIHVLLKPGLENFALLCTDHRGRLSYLSLVLFGIASDQCREIEEKNRMGKARDLFKKIRDTKGTFHAKMGTIKYRNNMELTDLEDSKKRWQEYTEELYKKDLHDPDNHSSMITHLKPDILECEVKWTLGSIAMNKASGGAGIPVKLFQILKDDAVKVLHSICLQIWKTQQWPQDWKRSVFIPIPKKGHAKPCSNYCTIALISHASKVMLKLLQGKLQQCMNQELPDVLT